MLVHPCSGGMGAVGLPGDWSSASRFIRAAFVKCNAVYAGDPAADTAQFFHMLDAVSMPKGAVLVPYEGKETPEITVYSSCCNTDRGIYYYCTYDNSRIWAVDMHKEDLNGSTLIAYPLMAENEIPCQNEK